MKKLAVFMVLSFVIGQINPALAQSRGAPSDSKPDASAAVVAAPAVNRAAEDFANKAREAVYKADHETAVKMLDEAIKLEPRHAKYRYDRAMSLIELNRKAGALLDLQVVIELDPNKIDAYGHLGKIYYEMNNFNECAIELSKGIAVNPNVAFNYYQRGQCYYQMVDNQAKAQEDFKKAIALDPSYAELLKAK